MNTTPVRRGTYQCHLICFRFDQDTPDRVPTQNEIFDSRAFLSLKITKLIVENKLLVGTKLG